MSEITAEDVRIEYDSEKLQFLETEECEGIKLVKSNTETDGELRFILASKGKDNIIYNKKSLLKLRFKAIAKGDALVDIIKGRVSDGISTEEDVLEN